VNANNKKWTLEELTFYRHQSEISYPKRIKTRDEQLAQRHKLVACQGTLTSIK